MRQKKERNFLFIIITALVALLFVSAEAAEGKEPFEIKRVGNINPYADNVFLIRSDEEGQISIRIHDNICTYRTISERISAGENRIHWDGCGYNEEKLYEKDYTISAELITSSGHIYSKSFNSPIEYPLQCLQYAMPSSDHLYLDAPKDWFIEYRTVTDGTVCIEISRDDQDQSPEMFSFTAYGGKIGRKDFSSIDGKKRIKAGEYMVSIYEKSRPEKRFDFHLCVSEKKQESPLISATGEIMPDRSMTDSEIWEMMMRPSVVVDIDFFKHQEVYENPDENSRSLGTLHGQTQGIKIISIEGDWAFVGAWNHEDASYVEGWVPLHKLKTEYPAHDYGLLIDKQKQTLTVYHDGKVMDTLLISSGRSEKNKLYQETSAGCFLTGYHRVNFSMNGKKYDYVIQYDGGNLLHQTPYDWGHHKKDFTLGRGYLGAKASHACIRIQPEPGPGGINAFWLFTHLPYHTRVVILDDPDERTSVINKLSRDDKDRVDISRLHTAENKVITAHSEDAVTITFGGCINPGGTKAANSRKNSFASFVRENGFASALAGVRHIFEADDLTCVNLGCYIPSSEGKEAQGKGKKTALYGAEDIFRGNSVELVQMISDDICDAGQKNYDNTVDALRPVTEVLERENSLTIELKGHLFGFAGCSESEYLKDPEIIDRRISKLKAENCEKIILTTSWGEGNDTEHSIVQEAMAHRGVRAGADLVIGDCPGKVQGADWMENVPVFYSLGDLMDGSTTDKPKNQQGILIQAEFSFKPDNEPVFITVIPVLPYGNEQQQKNAFSPTDYLKYNESESIINCIWKDTADQVMNRFIYYIQDRS